jgi:DNA-binding response OmpR family regulator
MGKGILTATDLAPRKLGGCRVLVVEPCEDSAAALAAMLRLNGFDARTTHTGRDALTEMKSLKPRAVILDHDLPDIDCCDAIRRIRRKLDACACAVLVLSAHTAQAKRDAAIEAGADEYHMKPADPVVLVRSLNALCNEPEA